MVQCTVTLCTNIAQDPLRVSQKLFANGLVSEAQVSDCLSQSKDRYSKASELLLVITTKIKASPDKFELIFSILNEFPWLREVMRTVRQCYMKNIEELAAQNHGSAHYGN